MSTTIRIDARQSYIENADDCLAAAVERYVEHHQELEGYDLSPRWEDAATREVILLDVPDEVSRAS